MLFTGLYLKIQLDGLVTVKFGFRRRFDANLLDSSRFNLLVGKPTHGQRSGKLSLAKLTCYPGFQLYHSWMIKTLVIDQAGLQLRITVIDA